jgi:hypothetical protein
MIPEELKRLKQWIKLPPGQKFTTEPGWQQNPLNWNDIQEPNGRGFLLKGTPYLVIDGDHVLARPAQPGEALEFASEWAGQFFEGLLDTFAEISFSGTGLHIIYRLSPASTYEGKLDSLKHMEANGGRRFDYALPGFDYLPKNQRPHIEIFYNAVREICLTDKAIGSSTIQEPPSKINELLNHMEAFNVPEREAMPASIPLARQEPPPEYDLDRAAAMLEYIEPAGLNYQEWVKVGQILHDMGADISLWDSWSQRDSARYKGGREITSKWASFKGKAGGATISTLHSMAKMGGYVERDFARDWHREREAMQKNDTPIIRQAAPVNPWAGCGTHLLVDNVKNGVYEPISCGIDSFDKVTDGGFCVQQLYGIAGRPGSGKSALSQWLSECMALNEGVTVLYMCLEMSTPQLQARSISRLMFSAGEKLSPLEILRGKGKWMQGVEAYDKLYGGKIAYVGLDVLKEASIDRFEQVFKEFAQYNISQGKMAPVFVVDYLQLLRASGLNETEGLTIIMPRLKAIAMNYNTIGFVIIATNRTSNKEEEATMDSGRGSSSIEFGLDLLFGVKKEKAVDGVARMIVTPPKGRWTGDEGKLEFDFRGKYMHFTELEKGEYDDYIPMTTKEAKIAQDLFDGVKK